jgi:hypothetical protein
MAAGGLFGWLFGPSREEIWKELAADTGMEFRDGGFWGADTVVAEARGWTVILDSYATKTDDNGNSTTYTRLRSFFFLLFAALERLRVLGLAEDLRGIPLENA